MTARKSLGVGMGVWIAEEAQDTNELSNPINVTDTEKTKREGFGRAHSHHRTHRTGRNEMHCTHLHSVLLTASLL